jgi:hypothetical protein
MIDNLYEASSSQYAAGIDIGQAGHSLNDQVVCFMQLVTIRTQQARFGEMDCWKNDWRKLLLIGVSCSKSVLSLPNTMLSYAGMLRLKERVELRVLKLN